MEHEFYSGLSILMMVVYATKKFGPQMAAYLDKEVDVSLTANASVDAGFSLKSRFRKLKPNGMKVATSRRKL